MMKVAIVNRHPQDVVGGSEIQCDGIATRLSEKGHEIYYIATTGNPNKDYKTNYSVITTTSNANAIANTILDLKPDIVYWRLNKYHFYRAAKKIANSNIPIVFAVSHISDTQPWSCRENMRSGLKPFLRGIKQGAKNLYNHQGFRYVQGVTVNNPDLLHSLPVKNQHFIPNVINTAKLPFTWEKPFVVWVANIKPAKQPELFIKLAKALQNEGVDFLMVGNIQSSDYKWIKEENKKTTNFQYLGAKSLEEVNGIIEKSLFLVHTCKPEGFPGVFIQAWLENKPTITLSFDPGQYIEQERIGYNAKNDWNTYVNKTKELIDEEEKRVQMGQKANSFASEIFSPENSTVALESFLQKVFLESK